MTTSVEAQAPKKRSRPGRIAIGALVSVVVVAGAAALWVGWALKASLPRLEGELPLAGLAEPVRVERDARGVPVVRGSSRLDVARATGFLHAQERFFQMDLLRRRAAGELSEIFGEFALEMDREVRPLRLRRAAHRAMASVSRQERAMLDAYTEGVNAGLQTLGAMPFEYRMLRVEPQPWLPADTGLCVMAMFLTLQQGQPGRESTLGLMHDLLPPELVEFLVPRGTEWDAPLEGAPFAQPAMPGPEVLDLRLEQSRPLARISPGVPPGALGPLHVEDADHALVHGSNNWAVAGTHTAHGGALLANDMHLGLDVPNIWYRASLVFPAPEGERRITGVMLPGVPFVVVGSNGHVAWGFTNSHGDWSDLIVLETDPDDPGAYLTPEGPRAFERATETIRVRGGEEEPLEVLSTILGPGRGRGPSGTPTCAPMGAPPRGRSGHGFLHDGGRTERRRGPRPRRRGRHSASESRVRRLLRSHRLDDRRPNPAPGRFRRPAAGLVGRRFPRLGRLARRGGVPEDRRSPERADLDRERPGGER